MLSPDEPYPPFSPDAERRYQAVMVRLGRRVAEGARSEARAGRADSVSEDHVDLAAKPLLQEMLEGPVSTVPDGMPIEGGVPVPILAAMMVIAGTALIAGLQGWRWANFAVAALLLVLVCVCFRRRRG